MAWSNAEIAADWRAHVVSEDSSWKRSASQAGVGVGDGQGFAVESSRLGRRAYLKPGVLLPDAAAKCRPAREKIAADLAFDLGLPVPPAILWRRKPLNPGEDERVVLSLFLHPIALNWIDVMHDAVPANELDREIRARTLAAASPMIAFDTWVDHDEHGDHHAGNLVWSQPAAPAADPELVFVDFASSLGSGGFWADGGWSEVRVSRMPRAVLQHLDHHLVEELLGRIESFSSDVIRDVVHRIPEDFLPAEEKDVIVAGLVGRRGLVAEALREGGS